MGKSLVSCFLTHGVQHTINTKKTKPGLVALRRPAWKRSGSILEGKDT